MPVILNTVFATPRYNHIVDSTGRHHTLVEIDRRLVAGEDNRGFSQLAVNNWSFVRYHDGDGKVKYTVSAANVPGPWGFLNGNSLVAAYRAVKVPSQVPPAPDVKGSLERIILLRTVAQQLAREFIGSSEGFFLSDQQLREVDKEFVAWPKRYGTPDCVVFNHPNDLNWSDVHPYPTICFAWFSASVGRDHEEFVEFDLVESGDNEIKVVPRDEDEAEFLDMLDSEEPPAKRAKVVPATRLINVELNPGPGRHFTVCLSGGSGLDGMFTHVPGLTLSTLWPARQAEKSTDLAAHLVPGGTSDGMREMLKYAVDDPGTYVGRAGPALFW